MHQKDGYSFVNDAEPLHGPFRNERQLAPACLCRRLEGYRA